MIMILEQIDNAARLQLILASDFNYLLQKQLDT